MLDIKRIRSNPDELKAALALRHKTDIDVDALLALDESRRALMAEVEAKKARRNADSAKVPQLKKAGEDVSALLAEMKRLSDEITALDAQVAQKEEELTAFLLSIPNIPCKDVTPGKDDSANVELRRWGEPRAFDFEPKPHWDIGTELNLLDFDTGAKVTGAR